MAKILLKCVNCQNYTINKNELDSRINQDEKNLVKCEKCSNQLKTPHPPRFSVNGKYNKYLRLMKQISEKNH